jgi:hypothetical protein
MNLAITTSGASLSTILPTTISPSRLLQASTFLTAGDSQYVMTAARSIQIGPTFTLSLYMLFSGHIRPENEEDIRQSTWKEVIHKARVKLVRLPLDSIYSLPDPLSNLSFSASFRDNGSVRSSQSSMRINAESKSDEYAYQLIVVEDLDDNRVHSFEDEDVQPSPYDDIKLAGIREAIPIHEISKIFYADTGKILNIGNEGESNSPVLLLKRDINAEPPRRMVERFSGRSGSDAGNEELHVDEHSNTDRDESQAQVDAQIKREYHSSSIIPEAEITDSASISNPWQIPHNLDSEWLAFEVYAETPESDTDSEPDISPSNKPNTSSRSPSLDPQVTYSLSRLQLENAHTPSPDPSRQLVNQSSSNSIIPNVPPIRTSLSLLETLLRLLSLQQFQQTSHLAIPDELLNFFLSESATTGAAHGDEQERRRLRNEARRRVGFDPYDESPIKRRGEDYQYRGGESQAGWNEADDAHYEEYAGNQSYHDYGSPRFDEGYETHQLSASIPYARYESREATPETPQMLLKNRPQSSRSNTPDRPTPLLPGSSGRRGSRNYPVPRTPPGAFTGKGRSDRMQFVDGIKGVAKRGSPLARPSGNLVDEGLGTSPSSVVDGKR